MKQRISETQREKQIYKETERLRETCCRETGRQVDRKSERQRDRDT